MITKSNEMNIQQVKGHPTSNSNVEMISQPKATAEKDKKIAVESFIRKRLPEVTEERLEQLLDMLKKNALASCQSFALTNDESGKSNGEKERKDLNGEAQMSLLKATLDKTVEYFDELDVLYLCRGLWAIEFILQPKWSNMSRNRRNKNPRKQ